jgi:predicted nucleic acid-binding Zn ribbon protein
MRRSKTHNIGDVIRAYLTDAGLDRKLKEVDLIQSWEEIVGAMISNRTKKIEIRDGTMFVYLQSSVVKNELMMLREPLKEALNKKAGEELIREIVLK